MYEKYNGVIKIDFRQKKFKLIAKCLDLAKNKILLDKKEWI